MLTAKDVESAQNQWAQGVVQIGKLKDQSEKCREAAEQFIDRLYAFEASRVLFKPTRAAEIPFRFSRQAAISYFIGSDPDFQEDTGFTLEPWAMVQFDNACIHIANNMAAAMGHYTFTSLTGKHMKVEYTFGYLPTGKENQLKIWLHHSSLPFNCLT